MPCNCIVLNAELSTILYEKKMAKQTKTETPPPVVEPQETLADTTNETTEQSMEDLSLLREDLEQREQAISEKETELERREKEIEEKQNSISEKEAELSEVAHCSEESGRTRAV